MSGQKINFRGTEAERFWKRVKILDNGCWQWTGAKIDGYGNFWLAGGPHIKAHNYSFTRYLRSIPKDMELDHLCRNPACVNPLHLEPVSHRENLLRGIGISAKNVIKTKCPQGHPYSPTNTYTTANGWRQCRACRRVRNLKAKAIIMNDDTKTLNIINLEKFKNTILLTIQLRKWGNRAQVKDMKSLQDYIEQLKAEPGEIDGNSPSVIIAGDRVKSSKVLIKSSTYNDACRALNKVKLWVVVRSMPSQFQRGTFVIKDTDFLKVENGLNERLSDFRAEGGPLQKFLLAYPQDVENARTLPVKKGGLGPLFRSTDYPSIEELPKLFDADWFPMALSVPENIPDELKAEAGEKFKRRLMDAAEDIEQALRVELQELLEHAEERLTTEPGEKPKVFRDSLVGNLISFIETFDSKNVFGDARLAGVVAKAKSVLVDDKGDAILTTDKLRKYASVRDVAKKQFADIRTALDGMIQEKATRKFDFEE